MGQPPAFTLDLTEADKTAMGQVVRAVLEQSLDGAPLDRVQIPEPQNELQAAPLGAFVTLKRKGRLRGCIGMVQSEEPLCTTLARMAYAAAFRDHRFQPLRPEEYPGLELEISIMGPVTPCPDPARIIIGKHGLILRKGGRSGLLLPQVPVEWNWDVPTYLEQLCAKAGLSPGSWKAPDAVLLWFEAVHFDVPREVKRKNSEEE